VGLESWAKSSGSAGVQVYVPLNSPASFPATKAFARSVADVLARRLPDRVVAKADRAARRGRVLVDWGQNDRHKSTVAAYSLRAKRPWPTVSAPLTWEELAAARDEAALLPSPDDVLRRLQDGGDLFAPVLTTVQELPR
jgi:bifunctional non-homologous end joining protein LigD